MADVVDVVIVGAGPVGLVSALFAKRLGLNVVVVEPRAQPVDKPCGEGLMPSAVSVLRELEVETSGMPFYGISYLNAAGDRQADAHFRGEPGMGVRRVKLQSSLVEQVTRMNVAQVRSKVTKIDQSSNSVTATLASGQRLTSRFLIGADGLHSAVRARSDVSTRVGPRNRFGLRVHFDTPPWSASVEVYWSESAEAYVTPVASNLVGVAVLGERAGGDFRQRLTAFPGLQERLDASAIVDAVMGAGPLRQSVNRRVSGRVLLVGDAAGYVDALTGEGLAVGFETARAALSAIVADDVASYERQWRRITRKYRWSTLALLGATSRPVIRRRLIPIADRLPRTFNTAVNLIA